MRPEISAMIKFLYPDLTDDIRVTLYPDVRGVYKNVQFITHSHQESSDDGILSKFNDFEAQMIIRFTKYLL